jgi:alpha-D-ribose 1-methylphosphonate 5-triphosphate synthase subunit PhnH
MTMIAMTTDSNLAPGFAEPVLAAQQTFRAALVALAHPGRIVAIDMALETPPPLDGATAALGLALLDHETPVWLDAKLQAAAAYFRFHCGCPISSRPGVAHFAIIDDVRALPPLTEFRQGSDEYPDQSATLILQVDELMEGGPLQLSGPGIAGETRLGVGGLSDGFWREWPTNNAAFPRGVDVFFTCGARLCGLPRTTKVRS